MSADNTTIFLPLIMKSSASGTTALPDVVVEDISLTLVAGNTYTVTLIARNQGGQEPDHTGCACTSMEKKAGTRSSHVPWQCSCSGQYTRAEAHAAANDK